MAKPRTRQILPTIPVQTATRLLREGKAFQGLVPGDLGRIDWPSGEERDDKRSQALLLLWRLGTAVSVLGARNLRRNHRGKVDIEIDCPMIDETQPLSAKISSMTQWHEPSNSAWNEISEAHLSDRDAL